MNPPPIEPTGERRRDRDGVVTLVVVAWLTAHALLMRMI